MKTVWLVTNGEYSDFHVVGIFSSKENAELVVKTCGGDVEETPIDPFIEELNQGLFLFWVSMWRDGEAQSVYQESVDGEPVSPKVVEHFGIRADGGGSRLNGNVWAKDKEHAVKIFNEKRAQMIASGEWPCGH
jgi:hypothetical protein